MFLTCPRGGVCHARRATRGARSGDSGQEEGGQGLHLGFWGKEWASRVGRLGLASLNFLGGLWGVEAAPCLIRPGVTRARGALELRAGGRGPGRGLALGGLVCTWSSCSQQGHLLSLGTVPSWAGPIFQRQQSPTCQSIRNTDINKSFNAPHSP